ncbi:protein I'm not dead yet-like isoform X3 [Maniola hyperantus]|uniref:protein I'm not dead yet-like isoform X3 n=1 Tax=Aphantopus hyperantus TaxID=2795564 RepID=UPI003749A7B5
MDSDTSESNLVIITNRVRFKRFLKSYRKTLSVLVIPIIFMPIAFIGENNTYKSFYVFLVTAIFFTGNFLHPGVTSFFPIVFFTIMGTFNKKLINTISISNSVLDCLGVMAMILAVEHSNIHKRAAIKILLIFGCSHFRVQNYTALQASLTSDEEQFISVLLAHQYQQMGKITFPEMVVCTTVVIAAILQAMIYSSTSYNGGDKFNTRGYVITSVPCIICVLILFLIPNNLACLKFFRKQNDNSEPLPTSASGGFLTWSMVKNNVDWTVIFLTASANITFDSLEDSGMTEEFEKFLSLFSTRPLAAQACVVIVFCKILTEFASNATVGRCLLARIANVGLKSKVNPLYLMLSATLSTSLPFHLATGTPAYAMIASYVHIPPRKLMVAGIGPSLLAIIMNLFTVCVWSKVIWPDIDSYPAWADGIKNK